MCHAWEIRTAYRMLCGKRDGNRARGKAVCLLEDKMKTSFREIGCVSVDLSGSGQDSVACLCKHGNDPLKADNFFVNQLSGFQERPCLHVSRRFIVSPFFIMDVDG
jgi:hypothetical protein